MNWLKVSSFALQGHVIVIGNKSELNERREVQFETAMAWAGKEKCNGFFVFAAICVILYIFVAISVVI